MDAARDQLRASPSLKNPRRDHVAGPPEPRHHEVAEAATNRIANQQRTPQHGHRRRHAKDDGEARAPVIGGAAERKARKRHVACQLPTPNFQFPRCIVRTNSLGSWELPAAACRQNSDDTLWRGRAVARTKLCAGGGEVGSRSSFFTSIPPSISYHSGNRSASAALWVTTTRMVFCAACSWNSSSATVSAAARSRLPVGSSDSSSRAANQGPGQGGALPFAAGQFRRPVVEAVGEADRGEQRARTHRRPLRLRRRARRDEGRGEDVLEDGALRQQRVVLEDEADVSLRKAACSRSPSVKGSWPSSVTVPDVGGSSVPRMYSSVLLPLPDGPMIATAAPRSSDSDTPLRMGSSPRGVR